MHTYPPESADPEHDRLRDAVQAAQKRYELVLRGEMADQGDSAESALTDLSAANEAYDEYLKSQQR